jgi:D-3-phosphoglycerate dehydrogenase
MVAEIFRALGNPVIGYDLYPDKDWASKYNVELMDMNDLLCSSDILTIHVPGNNDGSHVLGLRELKKLKNDVYIVNVSRGGVIDEEALFSFLKENTRSSAAIDVFSEEPYNGKLCKLENIILTPHIGSYAKEGKLQMEIDAVKNLIDVLK